MKIEKRQLKIKNYFKSSVRHQTFYFLYLNF